jgi:pseudaminic acid cytidylyltransferase
MRIAIIPARGGSKRIPGKNIKLFHGKPMLNWPIEAAIASALFDRIIVSTDCPHIAEVARAAGAEVPFIRPAELAGDYIATVPVIQHAIASVNMPQLQHVCCIYPTAAFLTPQILHDASVKQQTIEADFIMPVTAFSCPIERALLITEPGLLAMREPEHLNTRTQDCQALYHDVGQFYYGTVAAWLSSKAFYEQRVAAIQIPKYRAHDIDTQQDWLLAELVFSQLDKMTGMYE